MKTALAVASLHYKLIAISDQDFKQLYWEPERFKGDKVLLSWTKKDFILTFCTQRQSLPNNVLDATWRHWYNALGMRTMYPAWIFYFRWRLIAVASWILKSLQSTGGTSLENSRHDNLRNRKKCFWNKKPHLWSIYLTSKSSLAGKSGTT